MISIIIPAYNEEKRLASSLDKLASFLKKRKEKFEVLVVDDASTDKTKEVAETYKNRIDDLKVLRLEKSPFFGKGLAVNKGMLQARGEIAIFTDADFSTPIEEVDKLLEKLNQGFDIAIGSRALDRASVKKKQNPFRELMGRVYNLLVQVITIRGFSDTQCGFKAFRMSSCAPLFKEERIFGFGFDVELLYMAQKMGLKIAEVPVLWYNDASSKVNPIRDSFLMFFDLFKTRLYHSPKDGSPTDRLFHFVYSKKTFVRFSLVGITNTTLDYVLFFVLTRFFELERLVANAISVETAIIWSFVLNSVWTFSERQVDKPLLARFSVFQTVQFGGLVVSQICLLLFTNAFGIYDLLAKVLLIPFVLIFNYTMNSRWTFRDERIAKTSWRKYFAIICILIVIFLLLLRLYR